MGTTGGGTRFGGDFASGGVTTVGAIGRGGGPNGGVTFSFFPEKTFFTIFLITFPGDFFRAGFFNAFLGAGFFATAREDDFFTAFFAVAFFPALAGEDFFAAFFEDLSRFFREDFLFAAFPEGFLALAFFAGFFAAFFCLFFIREYLEA
ncbi:MAG TPA: hypothetical protein VE978_28825 [Chitinophagales bacterium]|nr:hypothetical protein [Chitinophagales bacterium]